MVNKMADPSGNEGSEDGKVGRSNSFMKFLRSPSRSNSSKSPSRHNSSKKGSGNSLTRMLFGSKKNRDSSKKGEDYEGEGSVTGAEEGNDDDEGILDQAKEIFETTIGEVVQETKETLAEQTDTITTRAVELQESTSETAKETKHHLLGKVKDGLTKGKEELHKVKEGLKEGYDKAKEIIKEEFKAVVHEDKPENKRVDEVKVDEVKAPSLGQRFKEEVVAIQASIVAKKEEITQPLEKHKETVVEKKEEDNCMTSLAQGLQNLCAPWGSKKED